MGVHPFAGTFDRVRSSIELVPGNARLDPAPASVVPLRTVAEACAALVEARVPAPLGDPLFPVSVVFGLYTREMLDPRDNSTVTEASGVPAYVFRVSGLPCHPSRPASADPDAEPDLTEYVCEAIIPVSSSSLAVLTYFEIGRPV